MKLNVGCVSLSVKDVLRWYALDVLNSCEPDVLSYEMLVYDQRMASWHHRRGDLMKHQKQESLKTFQNRTTF